MVLRQDYLTLNRDELKADSDPSMQCQLVVNHQVGPEWSRRRQPFRSPAVLLESMLLELNPKMGLERQG